MEELATQESAVKDSSTELNNVALETPPAEDFSIVDQLISDMTDMQNKLLAELDTMQELKGEVDPDARDDYEAIIAQLSGSAATLGTSIKNINVKNAASRRSFPKTGSAILNAALAESRDLSDDKKTIAAQIIEQNNIAENGLSEQASQNLENVQRNMQSKIMANGEILECADCVVEKYAAINLSDPMLKEMIMQLAVQSLNYEQQKILRDAAGGSLAGEKINKLIDRFQTEGLINVQSLNNAHLVIDDKNIKEDLYARQIVAIASVVSASRVGEMLVAQYMQAKIEQQKTAGQDFVPTLKIAPQGAVEQGVTAKAPPAQEMFIELVKP